MATELEFCSTNIQFFIIIGTIICISLFFYVELKKLKIEIDQIKDFIKIPNVKEENTSFISKLMNPLNKNTQPMTETVQQNIPSPMNQSVPNISRPIQMKSVFMDQPPSQSSFDVKQIKTNIHESDKENNIIVNKTNDNKDDLDDFSDVSHDDDISEKDDYTDNDDMSDISIPNIEQDESDKESEKESDKESDKDSDKESDKESLKDFDLDIDIEELNNEITKQLNDDDNQQENDDDTDKLKEMTVNELKTILVDLKLPVSGNKTKLITRIIENTQ